jgi:hypothetical protein
MVGVARGQLLHRKPERLLLASQRWRRSRRLPVRPRLLQHDHWDLQRLAGAPHADLHELARGGARSEPAEPIALHDRLAVERRHDVAHFQPGARCRPIFRDLGDHDALSAGDPEALRQIGGHRVLDGDPHVAAHHVAVRGELRSHVAQLLDGNGETDPLARGVHGGVDADHGAPRVEQGPTRIAGVDGGVGLDEIVVPRSPARVHVPPSFEADDPGGHRTGEPEGISDGDHPLAHFDALALAQR